ncbi:MAG: hypothetical protein JWM32_1656 [Verrucomicrobia bacterium]|nr:hypothetical protein [Verrucomicrobiota bacterium]
MVRSFHLRLSLLLCLLPSLGRSAERWSQLTLGMSPEETILAIGEPLMRNAGRGLEVWIYDHDAEVLFLDGVIGWSTPAGGALPRQTADVWQANQGKNDYRAVLLMLPPPKPRPVPLKKRGTREQVWRPALQLLR